MLVEYRSLSHTDELSDSLRICNGVLDRIHRVVYYSKDHCESEKRGTKYSDIIYMFYLFG